MLASLSLNCNPCTPIAPNTLCVIAISAKLRCQTVVEAYLSTCTVAGAFTTRWALPQQLMLLLLFGSLIDTPSTLGAEIGNGFLPCTIFFTVLNISHFRNLKMVCTALSFRFEQQCTAVLSAICCCFLDVGCPDGYRHDGFSAEPKEGEG